MVHADVAALTAALAEIDPWGLVAMGAPQDEYAPEARDLAAMPDPTADDVLQVFWRWGSVVGRAPAPARYGDHPGISAADAHVVADTISRLRDTA